MKPVLHGTAWGAAWGAAWGIAGGFWLLAPLIVSSHYLSVATIADGLPIVAMLTLLFAFIGSLLGLIIYAIATLAQRALHREFKNTKWRIALTTGVFLVPAYVLIGCLIYAKRFGADGTLAWSIEAIRIAAPAAVVIAGMMLLLHLITSRNLATHRTKITVTLASIVFLAGATKLLVRLPEVAGPALQAHPLARVANEQRVKRPLIVIGIDGASWRPLEPLIKSGRLPTLASLIARGSYGDMKALWPPYWSTTAWSAIITGLPREEVGVYGDLVIDAPGLPAFQAPLDIDPRLVVVSAIEYGLAHRRFVEAAPPERSALKRPPVWEMLDKSGVKTGVIRFNFSYPARNQASIVISNRVVSDVWDMLGVKNAEPSGLAWPDSLRDELLTPFSERWTPPPDELDRIFPQKTWPRPADAHVSPMRVLHKVLPFDQRTIHAAVEMLRAHPDIEVLIIHLGGLDNVQHVFWQYRFPDDFTKRPQAADVKALGPVIDRYAEFVDDGVRQMIGAFAEEPNAMVISDHGMGSFENKPPFKGWHTSPGIFIAAGPDFPRRSAKLDVSYYDIVPTILDLKGLEKPPTLKGKSLATSGAALGR